MSILERGETSSVSTMTPATTAWSRRRKVVVRPEERPNTGEKDRPRGLEFAKQNTKEERPVLEGTVGGHRVSCN